VDLSWLQSIIYGLFSGLMDILPVSAQAHRMLLLKFYGARDDSDLLHLLIHMGIVAALYISCNAHVVRMSRAKRLSRVPKRRRKRPLDVKSLMDLSMLKTLLIPVLLGICMYQYARKLEGNLLLVTLFLFINGLVLYIPQFLPMGNKDSRTLSRVEALLVGLGGAFSVVPGISAVGAAVSISSACGIERSYGLTMTLLMNLFLNAGFIFYDILGIASSGFEPLSFVLLIRYILTAAVSFAGAMLGIRIMKFLSAERGYALFGFYCFGLALFTFVLNLMA